MIYMVEMDFPHPELLAEWHAWYRAHIGVLLTVPGFHASQRFQAIIRTASPYLALHEVASPALFESPEYHARGGPASTGKWRALHTNWRRNLLDGLDETPEVPDDKFLTVLRGGRDAAFPVDSPIFWLRGVGLDGTAGECGIAIISDPMPLVEIAHRDKRVRVYRPISEKIRAAAHRGGSTSDS
ncbi:MAG: hypothetical protein AB7H71_04915 [Alphaproteobacteria bacterium]